MKLPANGVEATEPLPFEQARVMQAIYSRLPGFVEVLEAKIHVGLRSSNQSRHHKHKSCEWINGHFYVDHSEVEENASPAPLGLEKLAIYSPEQVLVAYQVRGQNLSMNYFVQLCQKIELLLGNGYQLGERSSVSLHAVPKEVEPNIPGAARLKITVMNDGALLHLSATLANLLHQMIRVIKHGMPDEPEPTTNDNDFVPSGGIIGW